MIDRVSAGVLPDKPHTVLRSPLGELAHEEMFTRGGFAGAFSYFYHRFPITAGKVIKTSARHPIPSFSSEGTTPLVRRLYASDRAPRGGSVLDARVPILANRDCTIYLARATESSAEFYANGDGDELWFVQEGSAVLESNCGRLEVAALDYVWVPKSLPHRWILAPGASELRMCGFEFSTGLKIPDEFKNPVGQLRMDAPYTHRDFKRPTGLAATWDTVGEGPNTLVVKKRGVFTELELKHPLLDVVGWEGFVYPFAFPIEKYQPKTGMVHLPPTIHATFASSGSLICSFVPRVTDTHPSAIPCPYPHSSVDCDEVILYLRGNFTSRRGVGPGCISLHPAGIAHGPHPGAYEASIGSTRTDELAVMIDTYDPLLPTAQALALEEPGYHESWM